MFNVKNGEEKLPVVTECKRIAIILLDSPAGQKKARRPTGL